MKTYELTYIITPEITVEEAEAKAKEIESAIASKEGAILNKSNPSAKTFSYPIKKSASGFLAVLEFQAEPEKFAELKEIIEKDGKIVRHMVIIKKPARIKPERVRKQAVTEPVKAEEKPSASAKAMADKGKIELKDIEQELDELLS